MKCAKFFKLHLFRCNRNLSFIVTSCESILSITFYLSKIKIHLIKKSYPKENGLSRKNSEKINFSCFTACLIKIRIQNKNCISHALTQAPRFFARLPENGKRLSHYRQPLKSQYVIHNMFRKAQHSKHPHARFPFQQSNSRHPKLIPDENSRHRVL